MKIYVNCAIDGTRILVDVADDSTATSFMNGLKAAVNEHKATFEKQTHKVMRDELDAITEVVRHPLSVEHD